VVSNHEVGVAAGVDPAVVHRLTGISERRWAAPTQAPSDLAAEAGREALANAGLAAADVDGILVSTTSPDMVFPSTACLVQQLLACRNVPAFDVSASCSGFLYGLSMADAMIRSGQLKTCLVVAAEVKSRTLDRTDADTALLFGDGAGAVVVRGEADGSHPTRGLLGVRLHADGSGHGFIRIPAGGSRTPTTQNTVKTNDHTLRMKGAPLFRRAVRRLEKAVRDVVKEFGIDLQDVTQIVLHQANGRILDQVAKRLKIPADRICSVIEHYGNTSSASLPIALDHAVRTGSIRSNDLVVLGSFGGGLTWATGVIRW
jgi:3-oxoacyl-[acyl-carrier-protein] synthase-3